MPVIHASNCTSHNVTCVKASNETFFKRRLLRLIHRFPTSFEPDIPLIKITWHSRNSERGCCWIGSSLDFEFDIFLKIIVFSVSRGKNEISPHLPPWKNIFGFLRKKSLLIPLWKKSFRRPCWHSHPLLSK